MGMVNVGESQTSVSGDGLGVFSLGLYEFLGGQDMAIFRVTWVSDTFQVQTHWKQATAPWMATASLFVNIKQ